MSKTTIADYLAKTLEAAGVERIWGVTGDSLNDLSDSLRRMGTIRWMHTRHEEVAAFAAGADAAVTGKLAVCAGSCGPGNLHLINGLFDCHRNHVPVLAIAAQIPSSEIGLGYFQETHPQELFKECSHYVELVSHPEQFPRVLERAMRTAIHERQARLIRGFQSRINGQRHAASAGCTGGATGAASGIALRRRRLSMLLGDLLSARQLDLPIKIVVFNNSSLGFVAMEMKSSGFIDTDTDLSMTDFAAIAKGAGIYSERVEHSEELAAALTRAFAHPGPALVDVVTAKYELAMPPKIQWAQAKGFSLYMLRAVLNGRGDEVIELANTNFR